MPPAVRSSRNHISKSEAKYAAMGANGPHATYGDAIAGDAANQKAGGNLVMRSLEGYSYEPSSIDKAIMD